MFKILIFLSIFVSVTVSHQLKPEIIEYGIGSRRTDEIKGYKSAGVKKDHYVSDFMNNEYDLFNPLEAETGGNQNEEISFPSSTEREGVPALGDLTEGKTTRGPMPRETVATKPPGHHGNDGNHDGLLTDGPEVDSTTVKHPKDPGFHVNSTGHNQGVEWPSTASPKTTKEPEVKTTTKGHGHHSHHHHSRQTHHPHHRTTPETVPETTRLTTPAIGEGAVYNGTTQERTEKPTTTLPPHTPRPHRTTTESDVSKEKFTLSFGSGENSKETDATEVGTHNKFTWGFDTEGTTKGHGHTTPRPLRTTTGDIERVTREKFTLSLDSVENSKETTETGTHNKFTWDFGTEGTTERTTKGHSTHRPHHHSKGPHRTTTTRGPLSFSEIVEILLPHVNSSEEASGETITEEIEKPTTVFQIPFNLTDDRTTEAPQTTRHHHTHHHGHHHSTTRHHSSVKPKTTTTTVIPPTTADDQTDGPFITLPGLDLKTTQGDESEEVATTTTEKPTTKFHFSTFKINLTDFETTEAPQTTRHHHTHHQGHHHSTTRHHSSVKPKTTTTVTPPTTVDDIQPETDGPFITLPGFGSKTTQDDESEESTTTTTTRAPSTTTTTKRPTTTTKHQEPSTERTTEEIKTTIPTLTPSTSHTTKRPTTSEHHTSEDTEATTIPTIPPTTTNKTHIPFTLFPTTLKPNVSGHHKPARFDPSSTKAPRTPSTKAPETPSTRDPQTPKPRPTESVKSPAESAGIHTYPFPTSDVPAYNPEDVIYLPDDFFEPEDKPESKKPSKPSNPNDFINIEVNLDKDKKEQRDEDKTFINIEVNVRE